MSSVRSRILDSDTSDRCFLLNGYGIVLGMTTTTQHG